MARLLSDQIEKNKKTQEILNNVLDIGGTTYSGGYTTLRDQDRVIGTYRSSGSANGRTLYEGSRGGQYYYSSGGNKVYRSRR